jgi:hypothetical protein
MASSLLNDYAFLTGHPLIHQWQVKNGALPAGSRLILKIPFVLGGKDDNNQARHLTFHNHQVLEQRS